MVLYSINVFITFTLSQLGMVRHWWITEKGVEHRLKKLFINGLGLVMCTAILALMTVIKFREGGAITVVLTAGLVVVSLLIHRHYRLHRPPAAPSRRPRARPPPPKPA